MKRALVVVAVLFLGCGGGEPEEPGPADGSAMAGDGADGPALPSGMDAPAGAAPDSARAPDASQQPQTVDASAARQDALRPADAMTMSSSIVPASMWSQNQRCVIPGTQCPRPEGWTSCCFASGGDPATSPAKCGQFGPELQDWGCCINKGQNYSCTKDLECCPGTKCLATPEGKRCVCSIPSFTKCTTYGGCCPNQMCDSRGECVLRR